MLSLRKARAEDLMFYLELRNEPSTRKFQFNAEPIDLATHKAWFERKLQDPNCRLFVIEAKGKPVGQMRFDVTGKEADSDIAIVSEERGKGYGREAIEAAVKELFESDPSVEKVNAFIKLENAASQASFIKAGFQKQGIVQKKGQECIHMTYARV